MENEQSMVKQLTSRINGLSMITSKADFSTKLMWMAHSEAAVCVPNYYHCAQNSQQQQAKLCEQQTELRLHLQDQAAQQWEHQAEPHLLVKECTASDLEVPMTKMIFHQT